MSKGIELRGLPWALVCLGGLLLAATDFGADAPPATPPAPKPAAKVERPSPPAQPPKADVAAAKYWQAIKLFRSRRSDDIASGRKLLREAAAGENTHAQLYLAECYEVGGYGFPAVPVIAASYFRLAAERGNAFAKVGYADCLFRGAGVPADEGKAAEFATAALADDADYTRPEPPKDLFEKGNDAGAETDEVAGTVETDPVANARARAHFILAQICAKTRKQAEAQAHLIAAATAGAAGRSGIQQAAALAAVNYAFGRGVPRDLAKASEMLEHSRTLKKLSRVTLVHDFAQEKLIDSFAVAEAEERATDDEGDKSEKMQLQFGHEFLDRDSKDYNPAEAAKWFELAAQSGDTTAMMELGWLYAGKYLGNPDNSKAFEWFQRAGRDNPPQQLLAAANLAICYHEGLGTTKDLAKAREIAQRYRDKNIVCYLVATDRSPNGIVTSDDELQLTRRWADRSDAPAQYLLGLRYRDGIGVKPAMKTAAKWLEKAARAGNGPACCDLGYLYETKSWDLGLYEDEGLAKALKFYRLGAAAGDAQSNAHLAFAYETGHGVGADEKKAEEFYLKSVAIDPTQKAGLNNLGILYETRWHAAVKSHDTAAAAANKARMLEYYTKAEQLDSGDAASNLGRLYYGGALGERDFEKAYTCFEKAAAQGDTSAHFHLGEMHEKGEGVPVTYVEAAYHYRLAALDGDRESLWRLIQFYIDGRAGSQDFDRAEFWLRRLSDRGDAGALMTMVDLELKQQHYDAAIPVLQLLAKQRSTKVIAFANQRLSLCYSQGWGVSKDADLAELYLNQAVEDGNPDALCVKAQRAMAAGKTAEGVRLFQQAADESPAAAYSLGQMYYFGQYMPKDVAKAIAYLRSAAKEGHREAQYFLAGLTLNRVEGAPTIDEAIRLAGAAEAQGHPGAAALRDKLEKRRLKDADKPPATSGARST